MLRSSIFLLLVGFLQTALAQSNFEQFDYLTITEGLPHNTVFCLTQDQQGFIWAGTKDGLVRFDGYECQVFRQSGSGMSSFQGKSVHAILEDSKGNLWVGTQTEGLNLREVNTGEFRNLSNELPFKPLAKKWIKHLFEDRQGRIWIGTIGAGVWCYEPKIKKMRHFDASNSPLAFNEVANISQDSQGRIWIATSGKGIYYFDEKSIHPLHANGKNDTDFESFGKVFFNDKQGNLWVGTQGSGLYKIAKATLEIRRYAMPEGLSSNNVMGIAQAANGELLLATDGGGLNIFDPKTETFSSVQYGKTQGKLNSNALLNILVDRDANVWIGTFNGGINVYKAHKTRFETLTQTGSRKGELSHRSVLSICEAKNGQIYIGTDGGGLNRFDNRLKTFSPIPNQPVGYGSVVKTIFEDSRQRLWLGYFENGLSYFEPKTQRFKHFRFNPADRTTIGGNNVWTMTEDRSGKLWVGVLGGGLARLDDIEQGKFTRFNHHPKDTHSLSSDDIMVIFADKNDQIWVGTDTKGLNIFDTKTAKCQRFQYERENPKSVSANDIRCIFQDSKGRLWIGTESGGLNLWLGNGQFRHFTEQQGLISNAVMGIVEDKEGYLWVSTFRGVSRFEVESNQWLNFDFTKNSYLTSNQFNQATGLRSDNGVLYFGGINGLTLIRPEEVRYLKKTPELVLTDFKLFNQSVPTGKLPGGRIVLNKSLEHASNVELSYADNVFSIGFAALDFTDPLKNQYAFQMVGFDREWRMTNSDQRLVTYTNLEPDTYVFRVKGANNNGVWSNEKTLTIVITPPFWQTWWFKLAMGLLTLALARLILQIYTSRREMALKQKVLESDRAILTLTNENLAAEQAILYLQNEKLETEIQSKNTELMATAVQMAHKNEILISIVEQLEDIRNIEETEKIKRLKSLKKTIETEIEGERSWEQFTLYFDEVNQNFTTELLKKHPSLTQNDLRMCALTRLNMTNKELAAILNISVTGVEKSRYRLKKRLDLTPKDDLAAYLRGF